MKKIHVIPRLNGLVRYERWRSEWGEGSEVDEYSYLSHMCHPEDMLLSCKLLFPDFVSVGGGVFLGSRYDRELFDTWFEKLGGNLQATEKVINHTHLYDVFDGCSDDVDDRVFEQLANVMALSWQLVLREKFPSKTFKVEVSNTDQDYGPVISFYQIDIGGED